MPLTNQDHKQKTNSGVYAHIYGVWMEDIGRRAYFPTLHAAYESGLTGETIVELTVRFPTTRAEICNLLNNESFVQATNEIGTVPQKKKGK